MAACPSCGTSVSAAPGALAVCPACFSEFEVAAESATMHPRWDVLLPDGQRYEALNRHVVRERVYVGRVPIGAKARPTGEQEWSGIHEVPEFMAIFTLLGVDPPLASGTRRLAGWQRSRPDAPAARPPPRPVVAEGTVARVVAGRDAPDELELDVEPEPLPAGARPPLEAVGTTPLKRAFPWLLLAVVGMGVGLVAVIVLVWMFG